MAYKEEDELTVAQMAEYARCHRTTVLRWEQRGLIRSTRNHANHRLYTWVEANKLKEMLDHRYSDISEG